MLFGCLQVMTTLRTSVQVSWVLWTTFTSACRGLLEGAAILQSAQQAKIAFGSRTMQSACALGHVQRALCGSSDFQV